MTQPTPIDSESLAALLAELIGDRAGGDRVRVAFDGADAAEPGALADAVAVRLRAQGSPTIRVRARDFLRPASLRLEHGRTDSDSYYFDWLDAGALNREVLEPLGPGGSGWYLPTLWDVRTDRATRAPYEQAPEGAAVLVDGALLLGRALDVELIVHVHLGPGALRRRTPVSEAWTIPAFERYADEVHPLELADVVVRLDDPRRPAVQRMR